MVVTGAAAAAAAIHSLGAVGWFYACLAFSHFHLIAIISSG